MPTIPYKNIYRADLEVIKGYRSGSTINKAYRSGELIYYKLNYPEPTPPGPEETPLTFNILSPGTIQWKTNNSGLTRTIECRKNEGNWTSITSSTDGVSISVDAGDTLQFRGNNAKYANSSSIYNHFDSTAEFTVEGNIMSLIDSTNFATAVTLTEAAAFCSLFKECSGLTSAENLVLPATTLTEQCYRSLFDRTDITTAPKLPATTLATDCYRSMFFNCTGLTTAPELPATTLTGNCYYMMFSGCTNLNYIKCLATNISASNCTYFWVNGVSSTGTFVTPSSTNWGTGISGIPSGWTRVDA